MKKILFGAAAVLAIAVPGAALAQSGFAEVGYSSTDISSTDLDSWHVGGAAAWGGNGSLGFQLDGAFGSHEYSGGGPEADTFNLTGHIFGRNDNHMVGAFVGYGNTDFSGFDYGYWTLGVEGALYMSRTTLDGVIAYSDSDDLDAQMTTVDVGLTHFVTDNFSIGGGVGFGDIEGGSEFTSYGIGGEFQFTGAPISIFGGYDVTDFDGSDVDVLSIGARWNFGGTLLERDRSGASLSRNNGFARLGAVL